MVFPESLTVLDRNFMTLPLSTRKRLRDELQFETVKGDILKIEILAIKHKEDPEFISIGDLEDVDDIQPKKISSDDFKKVVKKNEDPETVQTTGMIEVIPDKPFKEPSHATVVKNLKRIVMDLDSPAESIAIAKARLLELGEAI